MLSARRRASAAAIQGHGPGVDHRCRDPSVRRVGVAGDALLGLRQHVRILVLAEVAQQQVDGRHGRWAAKVGHLQAARRPAAAGWASAAASLSGCRWRRVPAAARLEDGSTPPRALAPTARLRAAGRLTGDQAIRRAEDQRQQHDHDAGQGQDDADQPRHRLLGGGRAATVAVALRVPGVGRRHRRRWRRRPPRPRPRPTGSYSALERILGDRLLRAPAPVRRRAGQEPIDPRLPGRRWRPRRFPRFDRAPALPRKPIPRSGSGSLTGADGAN